MDINRSTERMRHMVGSTRARQMQSLPTKGMKVVPSDVFLWAAGASILISLGLKLAGRRDDALFVGEWPATMVALGVMSRLIGR